MTIEIHELVLRAVVDARVVDPDAADARPPTTPLPDPARALEDREALVARCVREVLRELRRSRER
jgi:hypothetical protein